MASLPHSLGSLGLIVLLAFPVTAAEPVAVRTVDAAPQIDGKLDDPCWNGCTPLGGFHKTGNDTASALGTEVRLCHDAANLYVGLVCPMAQGVAPRSEPAGRDADIFGDDLVEVMLAPDAERSLFVELAVNAAGGVFDALRSAGGRESDRRWNGDWMARTARGEGFYTVELAIPFYTLPLPESAGTSWRCNVVRHSPEPKELSAIAEGGTLYDIGKFVELAAPAIDLERYRLSIEPTDVLFDYGSEEMRALLELEVVNLGDQPREVTLSLEVPGLEAQAEVSAPVALEPGGSVAQTLPFDVEPLQTDRTDFFLLASPSAVPRLVVRDAASKEIVAAQQPEPPRYGWPLRAFVQNPWQADTAPEKTRAIGLAVATLLPDAQRARSSIQVSVVSRETGQSVAAPTITGPERMTSLAVDAGGLPWGAFDVRVVLRDGDGRVIATTAETGLVLPPQPYHVEVLNNLVSELAHTARRGNAGESDLPFMNPRDGWCLLRVTGKASLRLDGAETPLLATEDDSEEAEAMRRLPAGKHVLKIEGKPGNVIVRAVPAIVYNVYPAATQIAPFGEHTWDRLRQEMLPQCNVVEGSGLPEETVRAWHAEGKHWLLADKVPGMDGSPASADDVVAHWRQSLAYTGPLADGIQADEFLPRLADAQYVQYSRALVRMAEDPAFQGKSVVPFTVGLYQTPGGLLFLETLRRCDWPMSLEIYIPEAASEEENQRQIEVSLVNPVARYERSLPGCFRHAIVTLMDSSLPYCTTNVRPGTNFKVHLDAQLHALANHPSLFAPYGIQAYRSNYVDPDVLRAMGRMLRHYALEGSKDRFSRDPYVLPHLENPDFASAADGWMLEPADPEGIRLETIPGFGSLQGRYPWTLRFGDPFLVLRRSAQKPNVVRQEIRDLEPGRRYSLRVISASFDDLAAGASQHRLVPLRIDVTGAKPVEGPEYRFAYPFRSVAMAGAFTVENPLWMTFHWQVFEATQPSAQLTISDWPSDDAPGPAGEQTALDAVELQPYDGP